MPRQDGGLRAEILSTRTGPTDALFASARRLDRKKGRKRTIRQKAWQDRIWEFFDTIPEFRYAVNWVGSLVSRAVLEVVKENEQVLDGVAHEALTSLYNGLQNQQEMLRLLGIHLTAAGEAYIVLTAKVTYNEIGDQQEVEDGDWLVLPPAEIDVVGPPEDGVFKILGNVESKALVLRIWRPHPRKPQEPDSPSRAVLPVLAELEGLTDHVMAQIMSRLAGNGILLLPEEMSFGGTDAAGNALTLDSFLAELDDVMQEAVAKGGDAASRAPILLQAKGEYLQYIKRLEFWSKLDDVAGKMRSECVSRIALGMDMPPEMLTGMGDMNHWSSWQAEESQIKAHTEPLLNIIASSLTEGILWPYLEDSGMDEDEARLYWFRVNTTKIRLRPNRSKEAIELYDRGQLKATVLLTENGFEEADLPDEAEYQRWLTQKVAMGSTTPEQVAAALRTIGVALPVQAIEQARPTEAPQPRSIEDHPVRELPDTQDAVAAAAELLVFRALERAGARLKTLRKLAVRSSDLPSELVYLSHRAEETEISDLMVGAFDSLAKLSSAPFDVSEVRSKLDRYVSFLLREQRAHDPATMRMFLR